jgi:2-succinyl-5-enolpyruvyl-6-hydroxy-3-cyclohexene-1-carboxylate synthase
MYSDNKLIVQLVSLLKEYEIRHIVLSPGSRHFPLTHSLQNDKFFKLYSIVDERSAAFFALGLIQKYNCTVAVACTSGSAITNYCSAVSEAYYQRLPLLLLTADRVPEVLNQMEDQMIDQKNLFKGFIKYNVNLPTIRDENDEWYANRLINEALINLNLHGRGPVHINYPILSHSSDSFQTKVLPVVRKISINTLEIDENQWHIFSNKIINKKIIIIWGQSVNITKELNQSLDKFCEIYDVVILKDKLSNLHNKCAIDNTFTTLHSLSISERDQLFPDIVFTIGANTVFNNEIKGYLKQYPDRFEHWQIGLEDKIIDPYKRLTEIFIMSESNFFDKLTSSFSKVNLGEKLYREKWFSISESIEEPNPPYSQMYAIGKFMKSIPGNSVLQIANSIPIRMVHFFDLNKTVRCYCNRGVNGIDGSMSTAVGFASESNELTFLIIGDLSFFYDMNAIWNRHISKNLRILLTNNEGGAVMHSPFNQEMQKYLPPFTSAGHTTSAKGWVESLNFKYIAAYNCEEVDKGIDILTSTNTSGPILLEVFTKKENDVQVYKKYLREINRITFSERLERKTKAIINKFLK